MAASDPLGHSLRLDRGDLAVSTTGKATLDEVHGLDALAQSLTLALETQLGSDLVNVTFGFDLRAIGENPFGVRTRKEYLRLQLVRCVASDPRVKDIRELYFDDDPRFFELSPGVDAEEQRRLVRTSRRITATIVIETLDGNQLTLRAGVPSG